MNIAQTKPNIIAMSNKKLLCSEHGAHSESFELRNGFKQCCVILPLLFTLLLLLLLFAPNVKGE